MTLAQSDLKAFGWFWKLSLHWMRNVWGLAGLDPLNDFGAWTLGCLVGGGGICEICGLG